MRESFSSSPLLPIPHPAAKSADIRWYVKADYAYGPGGPDRPLQGNKVRKLNGHLAEWAKRGRPDLPILTFGGAFSNHLLATAVAGRRYGIPTIGVVRGEEVTNPILTACRAAGMRLHFIDRATYREKGTASGLAKYQSLFGPAYPVPEGGSGSPAKLGCSRILPEIAGQCPQTITHLQVCAGTGGTAAGIIGSQAFGPEIEVFPVLKGGWMGTEIEKQLPFDPKLTWSIVDHYHFGGYAKRPTALLEFCATFTAQYGVPLEPIYSGKLFFGVLDRIEQGVYPPGSVLVSYHGGGIY